MLRISVELLSILQQMIGDHKDYEHLDHPCLGLLLDATDSLQSDALQGESSMNQFLNKAKSLVQISDEQIRSYNYKEVPLVWRQMYTDSTILGAMGTLICGNSKAHEDYLSGIKALDMALIVAGPTGNSRSEAVHALIKLMQERIFDNAQEGDRSAKRRRLNAPEPTKALQAPHVSNSIARLSGHLYFGDFMALSPAQPFILSEGCKDWPAFQKWSQPDYLGSTAGPGRVVPVEMGSDYTSSDWGQSIMPLSEFLESFWGDKEGQGTSRALYLAQHDLLRQIPALLDDIDVPDYVYSAPTAPDDAPEYKPPANADGYIVNSWIGPAGTLSPAHTDPYFNCYSQVMGSKWVWVAPPSCSPYMSAFSSKDNDNGGSDSNSNPDNTDGTLEGNDPSTKDSKESSTSHLMTNTTRLDVTLNPLSDQLPARFREHVAPRASQAVLRPGDMLFMPPGWWHSMKSLERSISVSIWY